MAKSSLERRITQFIQSINRIIVKTQKETQKENIQKAGNEICIVNAKSNQLHRI